MLHFSGLFLLRACVSDTSTFYLLTCIHHDSFAEDFGFLFFCLNSLMTCEHLSFFNIFMIQVLFVLGASLSLGLLSDLSFVLNCLSHTCVAPLTKKCHFADFLHKIYDWKHLYLCLFFVRHSVTLPQLQPHFWSEKAPPGDGLLGRYYTRFFNFKNGLFSQKAKKHNLSDSKRSSFITDYVELQFDTATLIIPSFRTTQARGCKQRFKSDLLRDYLVPGKIRIYINAILLQ